MLNLVVITGVSGSGKSTVLKAFEDLGYTAIDNFPVRLLNPYIKEIQESMEISKLALTMDIRDKYFLEEAPKIFKALKKEPVGFEVIFLDARTEVIITRYNQTRRFHPLMKLKNLSLEDAIKEERKLLQEVRELASVFLDTSEFNVHQLREEIFKRYQQRQNLNQPLIQIVAFGYKYGVPPEANFLFDARILPNPYFVPELKELTGRHKKVKEYLLGFEITKEFLKYVEDLIIWLVENYFKEDKRFLSIGIGCTGGRHRSPAVVDFIAESISQKFPNVEVFKSYRDIEKDVIHKGG